MSLIGRDRCYVAVNDATVALYRYPRAELIGVRAGSIATYGDARDHDAKWEQLLRTNELYGENRVRSANGRDMRVSWAMHATTIAGLWLALTVVLSAQTEPDGLELIGTGEVDHPGDNGDGPRLTAREGEVVRLVALGASTRQIAAELGLSPETIRSHVRNAMSKTDCHTRAQLVAVVMAKSLIGE